MSNFLPHSKCLPFVILALLLLILPSWVQAHTEISSQSGWIYGFTHPISGLDHVLAMIAVGLWAGQTGGRAFWLMPLTFVFTMALGGLLGMATLPFAYAEHGIIFSLLIAGVLIASAIRLPLFASTLLIAVFAICHGYAHGSEMPAGISVFAYAAGFMLATALLHTAGIGIALLIKNRGHGPWLRLTGVVVALYGSFLFAS